MMNYTGARKRWSHDFVARMREDSNSRRKTASPAISISSLAPAQPHVVLASSIPRCDSMEPEAQMTNVTPLLTVLSPQPQSPPAQRQAQRVAKESSEKVAEKEDKSKLHLMKRIWNSLVRK